MTPFLKRLMAKPLLKPTLLIVLATWSCHTPENRAPAGFALVASSDEEILSRFSGDKELYNRLRPPLSKKFISPEGLVVRITSVDQEEENDAEFWRETLIVRLSKAGYTVGDRATAHSKNLEGKSVRFKRTMQGEDLAYMVAFFTKGKKIAVLEAGGPAKAFNEKYKLLQKSLASWNL